MNKISISQVLIISFIISIWNIGCGGGGGGGTTAPAKPIVNLKFDSTEDTSITIDENTTTILLKATLSSEATEDITVNFDLTAGTASSPGDYSIPGSAIILTGETTVNISLNINEDTLPESDETVIISIDNITDDKANKSEDQLSVTIKNDDFPTVSFTATSQTSSNESGTMTITAQLSQVWTSEVTVPFSVSGTSTAAGAGTDYSITNTPIIIPAGNTSEVINIAIADDSIDEENETVIVQMGTPTNAVAGAITTHTATITDDEVTPTVTFTSAFQTSTDETETLTITAELSGESSRNVLVPFSIDGTSTATGGGVDYSITSSPLAISAGTLTSIITVDIKDETLDEYDETIIINMGIPSFANQGTTTVHTVTIIDDDAVPTVTFTSASQASIDETGTMRITAQLSAVSGKPISVPFTVDGLSSATGSGTDYTITGSPLTINPGSSSADITINIISDTSDELSETVIVNMGDPTNANKGAITSHTATITDDDDKPTVNFTSTSQISGSETGTMIITAELSQSSGLDVTVPFTVDGASSAIGGGTDYSITLSPITITAGLTTGEITITIESDALNEKNETVIVNMGTPTNANKGSDVVHTATIKDDDPEPDVSFTSASQSSIGESGDMTITAQLSAISGKDIIVPFVIDGASTAIGGGTDYTITSTPLTISAGSTTADITISISDDLIDEEGETIIVNMGTPTNASQGSTVIHTATIDDDDATPTVSFSSASQTSSSETGAMTITAQLSAISGLDVTVPFVIDGGSTAIGSGTDYTVTSSPITIPAGSLSANIMINITSDLIDETNETIIINMGAPANASPVGITTHTATITDDDVTPTVSFTSLSQSSLNESGNMIVTAELSAVSGLNVTVPFAVDGGSTAAGSGTDYSITATPIVITAGSTSADIIIAIATDSLYELGETVIVNMGSPGNATQGAIISHTATITNDDPIPTVSFTSSAQSSADETGTMTIAAQLSAASGLDVTVPFSIHGASTATGGGTDYSISATPISISAGNTSNSITITLNDDVIDENNETVIIVMGTPINANQGATTSHTATIADDDATPTVAFTSASQTSTDESGTLTITAQLSAVSGLDVTIPYAIDGASTATGGGTDYGITSSPIIIPAGSSSANIDISISIDTSNESDETVIVNMGSPNNATGGGITVHTATIKDDDALPTVAFTTSSQTSSNESSTMTITAQLSAISGLDVDVPFTIDGLSTATGGGTDYSISGSPITITAGLTTASIIISISGDSLDENNEVVIVNMGTPSNANKGAIDVHTATITDDDAAPSISFTSSSQNSINESGMMTITAQLSAISGRDISLPFIINGSSTATGSGIDYSLSAAPLVIAAGDSTGSITISITGDTLDENNETVIVDMGTPANAVLGSTTSHTATIVDDDAGPTVTLGISGSPLVENGGSAQVDATLSAISAKDVTVNLAYSGTATIADDYTRTGTSIVIPAGNTTGSVTITGVYDSTREIGDETVVVDIDTVINGIESGIQTVTAIIDEPPVVSNITSASADGFYKAGSTISIQIEFSENVDVDITGGIPTLTLETGTSDPDVNYLSGTGSNVLNFNYTVISGENSLDLDSASVSALVLNGGTITDAAGNNAFLTVPVGSGTAGALANNKTIRIDTEVPSIIDVSSSTVSGTYGLSSVISVNVYFSDDFTDNIVVTGTPTLTLETGPTDAVINYTSVSGKIITFNYTIQNGHNSGDLDYQAINSLLLNGGTIKDQAGNSSNIILPTPGFAGSLSSNRDIVVDGEVPTILSVNSDTANGVYKAGDTVSIKVNFSSSVSVTGTPTLTLNSGTTVDYTSGDGSSVLVFDYIISAGETAVDLDYISTNSLTGTIKKTGGASNDANLALPNPGGAGSLAVNKNIGIDTTVPIIDSITSSTSDGTYGETSNINITVTFNEAVTLSTGTLDVTLDTGSSVSVSAGSYPATVLTGSYVVGTNHNSIDLDSTAISLNGGATLFDAAGNDADLTMPGTTIATGSNIVVDTSIPTISSITTTKPDGSYGLLETINVTVTFNEQVTLAGIGNLEVELDTGDMVSVSAGGYPATVLTGTYTVEATDNSSDLDSIGIGLTGLATLKGGPSGDGNDANLTMPVTTIATGSNIIIDTQAPVINSITSATSDGTYGELSNINVTVTLNEAVTLSGGTFDVTLDTGDLVSVSAGVYPATVLTGIYSVGPGDSSSDLNSTAVTLNGGATLTDAAGNSADLSMPSTTIASGSSIVIDTTPLFVQFSSAISGNGENVNSINLQVELSSTSGSDVTVDYSVNGASSAVGGGADYTLLGTGTATITSGSTTANISLTINNDVIDENNETIIIDLSNPGGGASIGANSSHTYTITDDDDPPTVSFNLASSSSVDEAASGSIVSLSLSSVSGKNVSVTLTDSGGTATSVSDYDLAGGSPQVVSFTPGQLSQNITITPVQDGVDEGTGESIIFGLSAPSNASLGAIATHTFVITDDDGTPTLAIQDVSVNENSGTATVNVNLAGSSGSDVTVDYSTVNGTANGSDYISASGTLTWPALSTGIQSFTVTISDDSLGETDETVILNINNPVNASIVDASGVMTIIDNDATLTIVSAETLDIDPVDGYIDHYKITFSESVTDSTFDGYTENSEGALTSKWYVAGYSGVRLDHGTAFSDGTIDVANDNIIYIKFNQGGSNDTGQMPELTSTAATIAGNSGKLYYGTGNVLVTDVSEIDSAKPYVWYSFAVNNGGINGSAGISDTLEIRYSESTNAPDLTGLDVDTVIELNNGNDFGASSDITSAVWSSTNYTDDTLILTFATDNPTAYDGDSIRAIGTTVLDLSNNSPEDPSKVLSPPIITGTFDSGAVGPVIVSAEYLDVDANGFIDHVKITFDKNVDESTFPGYAGDNQVNNVTSAWQVNGYNNVALDSTDTLDADPADNIIYLNFSESSSYDTGAKPDLTATSGAAGLRDVINSCYINTSIADCLDSNKAVVSTIHVSEKDKAKPLITLAMARPDARLLFIRFSENVWSDVNKPACGSGGQLVAGDFNYNDINVGGSSSVVNYDLDNCAETDAFVRMITDQVFTDSDIYQDRVSASTNQIYDASNNAMPDSLESTIVRTVAPYVVTTSSYYNYDTLKYYFRIVFSEPMDHASATTAANYILSEDTSTACTDISSVPLSVNAISSTVFDLESDAQCGAGDVNETVYSIQATTDIYDYNLIEPVGSPDTATTSGTSSTDLTLPRLIQAESLSPYTVKITFSEPMKIGDVLGSAECESTFVTAATCDADIDSSVTNAQYKYTITPSLGAVSSVEATADPSVFIITHNDRQIGSFYTVTVYAKNSATVNNIPEDKWAGNDMQGNPENKATFKGSGESIDDFNDGTLFDDPFADQTDFSFAFNFNNRIYLGPNNTNSGAFRFEADGSNPVTVTFFAYGVSDCTAARGGSTTFGYGTNPQYCLGDAGVNDLGPNGERGLVGFNSGEVTVNSYDFDILMVGPIKDNISHAYFTQDIDSELNWTGCALTNAAGNNTKSVQTTYAFGGNFYVGISSSHNVHSPVMNKFVLSESNGLLSCATGVDLVAKDINYIGKKGSISNPSSNIVGIESMIYIPSTTGSINGNDIFYIANNGGVSYWDVTAYGEPSATNNWATAHSFSTGTTMQLSDLGKLRPGQKGVPVLVVYKDAFYLARNLSSAGSPTVNNGAELLKCTTNCTDTANWSVVVSSSDFDYDGVPGSGINNDAIGFMQVNGDHFYLGFDNFTDGITIWKASVDITNAADFSQQGEAGAGMGSDFPYVFSSSSLNKYGKDYIYITVGKDETAIKVIRQVD